MDGAVQNKPFLSQHQTSEFDLGTLHLKIPVKSGNLMMQEKPNGIALI